MGGGDSFPGRGPGRGRRFPETSGARLPEPEAARRLGLRPTPGRREGERAGGAPSEQGSGTRALESVSRAREMRR